MTIALMILLKAFIIFTTVSVSAGTALATGMTLSPLVAPAK